MKQFLVFSFLLFFTSFAFSEESNAAKGQIVAVLQQLVDEIKELTVIEKKRLAIERIMIYFAAHKEVSWRHDLFNYCSDQIEQFLEREMNDFIEKNKK